MIQNLIFAVDNVFLIFFILLIGRCFLSWIPTLNWREQPWKFIFDATEGYLGLFRKIIPPVGMMDISPIVAFLALTLARNLIIFILLQFYRSPVGA